MNNQRQPVQGRMVRNPYSNFQEETDDTFNQMPVPATYELHHQPQLPVGRPLQPTAQAPHYPHPPVYATNQQPMMTVGQQQPLRNFANGLESPAVINCHNCHRNVTTVVTKQPGKVTFAWAILLGLAVGCCCIPFCVDSCNDKIHHCPACGVEAGRKYAKFI